ncbi:MAG: pirin family protein [Cyclobacteriaceae bacterium]|nr:pirin family protein [Cyclobacteriaceae bacterium]
MRSVQKVYKAQYGLMGDLVTYQVLPNQKMSQIDPFIFLNHHGPQKYAPNNNGLPFGPHPHRGMETVTFIIEGDIMHKDSAGHESIIAKGGIQWMTAGSGLIHAEVSSSEFKEKGGDLEILQLWLNLPAKYKMVKPEYIGLNESDIPAAEVSDGKIRCQVISGDWFGIKGAISPLYDVSLCTLYMLAGSKASFQIPAEKNIFYYMVKGKTLLGEAIAQTFEIVEFANDSDVFEIEAIDDSIIIIGHGTPFNEPVVARGPFVMNTEEEIMQAYRDYQSGKFGSWH